MKNITYWVRTYANPGITDQRAVETFIDCESAEASRGLRAELTAISSGNFQEQSMDLTIGKSRALKHGDYQGWAKMMLLWMANYRPY